MRSWALLLAAVGGVVAAVPELIRSGGVRSPWLVLAVMFMTASAGAFLDHRRSRAQREADRGDALRQSAIDGTLTFDGRKLPKVRDINDPTLLGVHRASAVAPVEQANKSPVYIQRDIDADLREHVAKGGFILLIGDSAAGKTRTAYEAIRAVRPDDTLVVPQGRTGLAPAMAYLRKVRRAVLWLDDLERHLGGADGLHASQIVGLLGMRDPVLICATLRAEERSRLQDVGRSGDESNRATAREIGAVLDLAIVLRLDRRFSVNELRHASRAATLDPRIGAAIAHADEFGVAEYLAAGPQLLARWLDGWAPGHRPRAAALVAAAIDCRRTGLLRPATRELLVRLHELYLAAKGGSRLRPESLEAAFAWATEIQQATTALLHLEGIGGYAVFDYLVDAVQRDATPHDRVPEDALRIMLDYADIADAFAITDLAIDYGWYDLAGTAAQTAFDVSRTLGDHPDALTAQHNLARIMMWKGDYPTALVTYRDVLRRRTAVLGEDHPDTLASRHDYAWNLSACGDHSAAEAEYQAVLASRARLLGANHRLTLSTRHNLAWVIFQGGDAERALTEYGHVLAARIRALGPDHSNTIATRHDLGRVATALGRYDEAAEQYATVLETWLRALGPDHPYVLTVRHNIGALAFAQGRLAEAERQMEAVLHDRTCVLGTNHPHTLATQYELARLAIAKQDRERAAELLTQVFQARITMLGPTHPHTVTAGEELREVETAQRP